MSSDDATGQDGAGASGSSDKTGADASQKAAVVFSQYSLLRNILSHLPMGDLLSAAQVSRDWKSVADTTKRDAGRDDVAAFTWIAKRALTKTETVYPIAAGATFQSRDHDVMARAVKGHMEASRSYPETAMILHATDLVQTDLALVDEEDAYRAFVTDVHRIARKVLPPKCVTVSMGFGGIVGTDEAGLSVEMENLSSTTKPAAAMVLLPSRPDVKIIPFKVEESLSGRMQEALGGDDGGWKTKNPNFRRALLNHATSGRLESDDRVKCVIALTNSPEIPHTRLVLQEIGQRTGDKFALGGAIGHLPHISTELLAAGTLSLMERERTYELEEQEDCAASSGLIIAGDGVEAASVLLDSDVRNEKKVAAVLSRLKGPWLDGRAVDASNTCAFMFACCGRGAGLYRGKKNVESRVFQRLFPGVPLIGAFGGGEIGLDYIPNLQSEDDQGDAKSDKPKKLLSSDDILHSYTTVFVMLSFKS